MGIPETPVWREEAHLGRAGEGCNFICSTLKSSANTGSAPKARLPQSRQIYSSHGAAWQSSCPWDTATREGQQHQGGLPAPGRDVSTTAGLFQVDGSSRKAAWRRPSTLGRASRLLPPSSKPREFQKADAGPLHPQQGDPVLPSCWSWASPLHWTHLWDADGTRGCAQHLTSLAGGTEWGWGFPGTEMLMPTSVLCHQDLPCSTAQHSAMLWLSFLFLSLCPMGRVVKRSRTQKFSAGFQQHPCDAVGGGTTQFWGSGFLFQLEARPWLLSTTPRQ